MTDIEKYEAVNSCESFEELLRILKSFEDKDGFIQGKSGTFDVDKMISKCRNWWTFPEIIAPNCMTRMWGLRQQMMYLKYYDKK